MVQVARADNYTLSRDEDDAVAVAGRSVAVAAVVVVGGDSERAV